MTITFKGTVSEIRSVIIQCVQLGLCNEQHLPSVLGDNSGVRQITLKNSGYLSTTPRDMPYGELYEAANQARSYNLKMLDGALVRMLYSFDRKGILSHRLAFFPCPHLEEFQNYPDIYLDDEIYADIVSKEVVPFPMRFDFDRSEETHIEVHHPKSHLTLGQYEGCRIPVTAPLTPFVFVEFVLRNFYNTAARKYTDKMHFHGLRFSDTITERESKIPHLQF